MTHETGSGRWDGGSRDEIFIRLLGSEGETDEHICRANRTRGAIGSCSFLDADKLGHIKGLWIRNTGDDFWALRRIEIKVNGVEKGVWVGSRGIGGTRTKSRAVFVGLEWRDETLNDKLAQHYTKGKILN